ncbi:MAG: DUF5668 domain-containing protein [Patescibacteria group bacterium]
MKNEKPNDSGPITGILFICIGLILLFNTMGYVSWDIWEELLRFWPVLLILWGVEVMLGKSIASRIISSVIVFMILLFIVVFSYASINPVFNRWIRTKMPLWPMHPTYPRRFIPPIEGNRYNL